MTIKTLDKNEEICKPCNGTGVQTLKSGIKIDCPSCRGTGKKTKHPNIK